MSTRHDLRALAHRAGIQSSYTGLDGKEHVASDRTIELLLTAMGFDTSSEGAVASAVRDLEATSLSRLMPPVRVVSYNAEEAPIVHLTAPPGGMDACDWELELIEEGGRCHRKCGCSKPSASDSAIQIALPCNPPPGYHRLRISLMRQSDERTADQTLIVAPRTCVDPLWRLGSRRGVGLLLNLYSVVSEHNWGVGDLGDIGALIDDAHAQSLDFIGLSPLHALTNRAYDICPYTPVSRLFFNPIYLDLSSIPEVKHCESAQALLNSRPFLEQLARFRALPRVDYDSIIEMKWRVLRHLYGVFRDHQERADTPRGRDYREFVRRRGRLLTDHATFMTLAERFGTTNWKGWPPDYRDSHSAEVKMFAERHSDDIGLHQYVQFELDRQLSALVDATRRARMPVGLYLDLALGSSEAGSDAWMFPDLFVRGVRVGAPPDPYSDTGQTWGFPPIHPLRLAESGYDYWIRLLQATMAHAGMIRIDHVMGLFRQFWIPEGHSAVDGAYVRFPSEDLLGIVALESQQHGAIVIGEDLGTVPPEVPQAMNERRMLSSRVVWFEREWDGEFKPSHHYPSRALTTVTTHDLPPLAGLWSKHDLLIRRRLNLITDEKELADEHEERRRSFIALIKRLREEGLLAGSDDVAFDDLCEAVHLLIAKTPSLLIGVYLDDIAGELDPVNVPGVPVPTYPCWSRRMRRNVESLLTDPRINQLLGRIAAIRHHP